MSNLEDETKTSEVGTSIKKIRNATDLQRLKLEKLQRKHAANKEVFIPERPKERKLREPLEFIRNIWGSSAGVGSGDFDVYRGIRRREYARQKFILGKSEKEDLDAAYIKKVQQNITDAEERTAKKRNKRLKKKERMKASKKKKIANANTGNTQCNDSESDDEVEDDNDACEDLDIDGQSIGSHHEMMTSDGHNYLDPSGLDNTGDNVAAGGDEMGKLADGQRHEDQAREVEAGNDGLSGENG